MGNKDDEPEGLRLREALEQSSDPAKLQEYDRLRRLTSPPRVIRSSYVRAGMALSTPTRGINVVSSEQSRCKGTWKELVDAFRMRLRSGDLIATGFKLPITPASRRIPIPRPLWEILLLNFKVSSVRADELQYVRVRVHDTTTQGDGQRRGDGLGADPDAEVKRPGARTLMPELRVEMTRRHRAGELEPELAAECRYLLTWIESNHSGFSYPFESLRRMLRQHYRSLRRDVETG